MTIDEMLIALRKLERTEEMLKRASQRFEKDPFWFQLQGDLDEWLLSYPNNQFKLLTCIQKCLGSSYLDYLVDCKSYGVDARIFPYFEEHLSEEEKIYLNSNKLNSK